MNCNKLHLDMSISDENGLLYRNSKLNDHITNETLNNYFHEQNLDFARY